MVRAVAMATDRADAAVVVVVAVHKRYLDLSVQLVNFVCNIDHWQYWTMAF